MILQTGNLKPLPDQVHEARVHADESFCRLCGPDFMRHFPVFDGWTAADQEAILLKMKNVEPHDDAWVGGGREPRVRRAIFWLLEGGQTYNGGSIFFGCGRQVVQLRAGDYVVFNDTKTHWVMSNRLWRGAAVQLKQVKP